MSTAPTASEQPAGLERFRALRRRLEEAVLPLATSIDGRRFTFQASLHELELRLGGYVMLESDRGPNLGQILALRQTLAEAGDMDAADHDARDSLRAGVTVRYAVGEGTVLAGDGATFHDAVLRPATAEEVGAWLAEGASRRAPLPIGRLASMPLVPAAVEARGFDRHTLLCGQSGSGKTHAMGVVLERLLTDTRLRMVVLDPNSDFARLSCGWRSWSRRPRRRCCASTRSPTWRSTQHW